MLDQLTSRDFARHLHEVFTIKLETIDPIGLELDCVTELRPASDEAGPARQPFSLLFLGPVSRQYLLQRTYRLEHDQMGALDVFLVPLGLEGGRMRYEAIFN
jgi:hypothetical protein